jgi:prevent-host-death family protein
MEIPAGKFKTHCLRLLDEVQSGHGEIIVTKRGRPVAKLVPIEAPAPAPRVRGFLKGTVTVVGDIVSPIGEPWEADG